MKLVVTEAESRALERFIDEVVPVATSCEVASTEVVRAVRRSDPNAIGRARDMLREVQLIRVNRDLILDAQTLDPPELGTLDAIHLATALSLGRELSALVTYDRRMQQAAEDLRIPVESPA